MSQSQPLTVQQVLSKAKKAAKQGKSENALYLYNAVLQHQPDHPVAKKALRKLQKKLGSTYSVTNHSIDPPQDQTDALVKLYRSGQLREANEACSDLLRSYPQSFSVLNVLGATLIGLGKFRQAVQTFDQAILINPDYADIYSNRGVAQQKIGQLDAAIVSHRKALAINDDYAAAHSNLGNALLLNGQGGAALEHHRRAVALEPENESFWAGFAASLKGLSFTFADDAFMRELSQLLEQPTVQPSFVTRPVLSAIWQYPAFAEIFELVSTGKLAPEKNFRAAAEQLSTIDVFLKILRLSPILDLEIERMLTLLRQSMLQAASTGKSADDALPFETALALQCFTNEYVFAESNEEKSAVDDLLQRITTLVDNKHDIPASWFTAVGAYRPLYQFPWARQLSEHAGSADLQELIRRQISEPLQERALRSLIPCLTPIENTISLSVREQYEESPYPRWMKTGLCGAAEPVTKVLLTTLPHLDLTNFAAPDSPEILVAGCGTGLHAITTAAKFSGASVLAVDLSLSSISYAMRKTDELGITNIEYAQADIVELADIGRQFDLIESVGVLHHLGDPLAGWKVLAGLLRPGGLMKIGLYSELARQDVVACRKLISDKSYTSCADDIRRCRQEIIAQSADGNTTTEEIFDKNDFFSMSECRDLLFHVQEHRFTIPEIETDLKELALEFLGFEIQEPSALRSFKKLNSQSRDLSSLPLWHQFEQDNPSTFTGMYQFWCMS